MQFLIIYRFLIARFIWPVFGILVTCVGITFETIFVYHGVAVEDYAFASESFCYFVILGTVPVVYASVLYNKDIVIQVVEDMNDDFIYIGSIGNKYKTSFLKGQLQIWQLCILWIGFCIITISLFFGNTLAILFYQSLFATQEEHMTRPLIFPMWLPNDDPYRSPNYEIFMMIQIILMFVVLMSFCAYIYTEFHILLHYYNIMNMINLDFETIFDGLDGSVVELDALDPRRAQTLLTLRSRMKRIVRWHVAVFRAVDTISSVYGPPLVYQVMFSSVAICVMAYQVVEQLEKGKLNYLFAVLFLGGCLQLWIPCYLGTLIRNKAFSVGDACWNCGWHSTPLGCFLRMDIIILILRAQQPVTIKFTGLPCITLETFSSIMSTSYSYFNMLRQSTKD